MLTKGIAHAKGKPRTDVVSAGTTSAGHHHRAMTAASTLSLKDAQRCFDKERRALLSDLETLRLQLVKKDQSAARAAAAASAHMIQLKREIATIQTAMTTVEAERSEFQEKFMHTSSLLETALDQRQEDKLKLGCLREKLRTVKKKHERAIELVKNEAAATVRVTQDERQALRASVDHLRGKLETEQKEWQNVHHPVVDELQKCKARLQLVDKELQDMRSRERASFQWKEKMGDEVEMYKRMVADLSKALKEAQHSTTELEREKSLTVHHMKSKWQDALRDHQHAKEQLLMLQEDCNSMFQSRVRIEQHNQKLYQTLQQTKAQHERAMKDFEKEWREKKHKIVNATCTNCLRTPEQTRQDEEIRLNAVREQTRLEVTNMLHSERWDKLQEMNSKYLDTCQQLHSAVKECEMLQGKCSMLKSELKELQETEQEMASLLIEAQGRIREITAKRDEKTQQMEETKQSMQQLVENLTSLTSVTADQNKKLQELEAARLKERDNLMNQLRTIEMDKHSIAQDYEQIMRKYRELFAQNELLKREKAGQASANLQIEEQTQTMNDLVQLKASSASAFTSEAGSSLSCVRTETRSDKESHIGQVDQFASRVNERSFHILRQECETLREEVARLQRRPCDDSQSSNEKDISGLLREIKHLQKDRLKLKKCLEEQALTIHELTLQEEESSDDEDANEREGDWGQISASERKQVAGSVYTDISPNVIKCVAQDIEAQQKFTQVHQNLPHQSQDDLWLLSSSQLLQ